MDKIKQDKLEAAGYIVGDINEFLDLTEEDIIFINNRLAHLSEIKRMCQECEDNLSCPFAYKIGCI